MSWLWIVLFCVALVWALSVVDIVRQHYSAWTHRRNAAVRQHRHGAVTTKGDC